MAQDKTLTCRDCGASFEFTASEQDFYAEKGFANEPSRCKDCRIARKNETGGRSGPREMFDAVCAACGAQTKVPFQPKNDRPVYCSDCFSKQR
jgi:CxxC-x17-CxxC domain-containing protein